VASETNYKNTSLKQSYRLDGRWAIAMSAGKAVIGGNPS
jgi:hypothetical protein